MTIQPGARHTRSLRSMVGSFDTAARGVTGWGLRLLVAACLLVDAVVHLQLAGGYGQATAPGYVSEGLLFRVESVTALAVALLVLVLGNRFAFAVAFGVTASAFGVVLLYRYVNVPAFGPIPGMYEPIWFAKKAVTAVAEGLGAVLSAIGFAYTWRRVQERSDAGLPVSAHGLR
ncbi:MAG: hypothetical protein ABI360_00730 [Allobranchiibius sp.]